MKARSQKNNVFTQTQIKEFVLWFEVNKRSMPWRKKPTPYNVWISEVMLQQTQVIKVIPYFNKFIQAFPTVNHLACAQLDDVYLIWAGLGYYSRARNLYQASKIIKDQYKGALPKTKEELLSLPGIGPYTAGAILSIAYQKNEALLDGNVERFFSRFFKIKDPKKDSKKMWELSKSSLNEAVLQGVSPRLFNQALMEHGALTCTPKSPKCSYCVFSQNCKAYQEKSVMSYPAKKEKKWINMQENVLCLFNPLKNQILLQKNTIGSWRAGMWDLPESQKLSEKFNLNNKKTLIKQGVVESKHIVTHHKINRKTSIYIIKKEARFKKFKNHEWVNLDSLYLEQPQYALSSSAQKTLRLLLNRLNSLKSF